MLGPLTLALALIPTRMGNTNSVTGPDRGRLHVIRDDDSSVDSVRGQRPERLRVEETVAQLTKEYSDEETNRKSNSLNVPKSRTSHNGAQCRGATMSSDSVPTSEVANEMGRGAIEVIAIANNDNDRSDETMGKEITSSRSEQNKRDENWPFCIKEIGRRKDEKSDSSSVESGGR